MSASPSRGRIVVVSSSYPRHAGDAAGRGVAEEATRLAEGGAEVHVLAPGEGSNAATGVRVHWLGAGDLFAWPGATARLRERPSRALALPRWLARANRVFTEFAVVDSVVAHWLLPCAFPAGWWLTRNAPGEGRAPSFEVVAHGSDVALLERLAKPIRHAVVRALLSRGARFRFVAKALERALLDAIDPEMAREVAARSYVEPLQLGLSLEAMARARARGATLRSAIALDRTRPLWVTCGRLLEGKGVDLALARAAESGARLVVVGDGPHRAALEDAARALGATADFTGHLSHDEALGWIAAADRFLHLSRAEGAPTVVREARALGVPVLASPAGDVAAWAAVDPGIAIVSV